MPWRAELPVETMGYVLPNRNRRWTGGWGAGTRAARWAVACDYRHARVRLCISAFALQFGVMFLDGVISKRFEETVRPADSVRTCSDVAHWYAENVERRMSRFEGLSGEDLATSVDWIGLRKDPAVAYLSIAIRHSVYHRGQLSAYLRPMGARVPAIYVESADGPFPPIDGTSPEQPPRAFDGKG